MEICWFLLQCMLTRQASIYTLATATDTYWIHQMHTAFSNYGKMQYQFFDMVQISPKSSWNASINILNGGLKKFLIKTKPIWGRHGFDETLGIPPICSMEILQLQTEKTKKAYYIGLARLCLGEATTIESTSSTDPMPTQLLSDFKEKLAMVFQDPILTKLKGTGANPIMQVSKQKLLP